MNETMIKENFNAHPPYKQFDAPKKKINYYAYCFYIIRQKT